MAKIAATKNAWQKFVAMTKKHPMIRGMAAYSLIWPMGSIVQQTLEGREEYDWLRALRFSVYGALYVAPTLTVWLTIARHMYPQNTISAALSKAIIEQVTYTPFAMTSFYFGMTLLEGRGFSKATNEVSEKFIPTYKVGAVVWPIIQTANYTLVAEKNRVVFVSVFSLLWTSFLAYMKHLQGAHFKDMHHSTHLFGSAFDKASINIPMIMTQTQTK